MSTERPMDDSPNVSRRDFLQRLGLFGAAGVSAGAFLAGCGKRNQ